MAILTTIRALIDTWKKAHRIQRSIYHSRRTEERTAKAEDTPTELFRLRTKASTNSTYFTPRKKPPSCTVWYLVTETIGKKWKPQHSINPEPKQTTQKKEDNNRRLQNQIQTANKKKVDKSISHSHNPNTEKLSSSSLQYTRSPHTYLLVVKRPFKEPLHYKKDIVIIAIVVFRAISALHNKLVVISICHLPRSRNMQE